MFCRRCRSPEIAQQMGEALEIFDELIATIGRDRVRVLIIPDQYQVDDALYRRIVGSRADEFDRDLPSGWLADFLTERGVEFLDLLQPLRSAEAGGATYKPRDTHWNISGNLVVGRVLADWLRGP